MVDRDWGDPFAIEIRTADGEMRRVMFEEGGVGLAAPQVGLPLRMMLAAIPFMPKKLALRQIRKMQEV